MSYAPRPLPTGIGGRLRAWLATELRLLATAFDQIDNLTLPERAAEPSRYKDGMIVYANGSDWDPGSGEGFYGRENGAWVKL